MNKHSDWRIGTSYETCFCPCAHQLKCAAHRMHEEETFVPHLEFIESFPQDAQNRRIKIETICRSFEPIACVSPKKILKEGLQQSSKPVPRSQKRKSKNKMAAPTAAAFLEYLERAEASFWHGTAKDARDQLDRAKQGIEAGVEQLFAKSEKGFYFADSIQRFGLAFYAAMPLIRKAGWSVHMQTLPGIGYYYEMRKKP